MSNLLKDYRDRVRQKLATEFKLRNPLAAPHLVKIVINMGVGEAAENSKALDSAAEQLGMIAGQKPVIRRAKKSISNFKLRRGQPISCVVTLRGARQYEFFEWMVRFALPRIRDFRGVPTSSFDGRGNYTLGIKEQIIFPEVDYDKIDKIRGMDITIVTSAGKDEPARALLTELGMPFARSQS